MEPYVFYLATSGIFLSTIGIAFSYLNDRYTKLYQLLEQKVSDEQMFILREVPTFEALSLLSRKVDELKHVQFPKVGEEPNEYLKRMGWDKDYSVYRKRIAYKHWKTKAKLAAEEVKCAQKPSKKK